MAIVKGKWKFNDVLTILPVEQDVSFTTNVYIGIETCDGFFIDTHRVHTLTDCALCYKYFDDTVPDEYLGYEVYCYEEYIDSEYQIEAGWQSGEFYKTVDFGKAEQTVSDEFYTWLIENAAPIDNITFNITENGTTTLATAGKYCDRNIVVNVDVAGDGSEDLVADLVQGTISGAYVSDKVTSVKEYVFFRCANLTSVSLPNCASVYTSAFRECTALESVNLPNCESFDKGISSGYVFDGASNLKTINVPNLTTIAIASRAFNNCKVLEEFNAPNLTYLTDSSSMFANCQKLVKVNLPKLGGITIGARTFYTCSRLEKLILGGNELNPLENVNAFTGTPIANGTGYVYVPDNLVEDYKEETNWATFANQIKPISELEE